MEKKNKLLECIKLSKSYDKKQALVDIDITIEGGKIIGLLGRNGSGKTTLIKLINGLLTANSGKILFCGKEIGIESKKRIAYLSERSYLESDMRVLEAIQYFEDFYEDLDSKKAYKLLKELKIEPKDRLSSLSKGTKEKVQLILVMSRKADLYVLDEPIGGVDPASRDYILNTILKNYGENSSVLISTHLISDIEKVLDEVIFIDEGKVYLSGEADELRKKHKKSIDEIFREEFKC